MNIRFFSKLLCWRAFFISFLAIPVQASIECELNPLGDPPLICSGGIVLCLPGEDQEDGSCDHVMHWDELLSLAEDGHFDELLGGRSFWEILFFEAAITEAMHCDVFNSIATKIVSWDNACISTGPHQFPNNLVDAVSRALFDSHVARVCKGDLFSRENLQLCPQATEEQRAVFEFIVGQKSRMSIAAESPLIDEDILSEGWQTWYLDESVAVRAQELISVIRSVYFTQYKDQVLELAILSYLINAVQDVSKPTPPKVHSNIQKAYM